MNHSVRSYVFAQSIADRMGLQPGRDYDPELQFLATVLHDIGLAQEANGPQRFEVDGADRAADFMRSHGYADPAAELSRTNAGRHR